MKKANGYFTTLNGEQFYKIENYDYMDDFCDEFEIKAPSELL